MKFNEYIYERPDLTQAAERYRDLLQDFENAPNFETQSLVFQSINTLKSAITSAMTLAQIRHTIDTRDEFYDQENRFCDENAPHLEALNSEFYRKLVASRFRPELEARWGKQLFTVADLGLTTFSPEIVADLQQENRLASEYVKIKATASLEFEGNKYNLSSIIPLETSPDRNIRRQASAIKWNFFAENAPKVAQIFDDLVKTRTQIAQKLGFKNFVELGYARMLRSDYNAEMVANFRKQVQDFIVPLSQQLYERQRKRLRLNELCMYDEEYKFPTGNPTPKGNAEEILRGGDKMYEELSPETHEFFQFLRERDLLDVEAKDGKATGGYCTYIEAHQSPFIFSNFNGTSGDIDVLTHEAGHAFQVYCSRDIGIGEYRWPTYEACEIHSMSMEFFTWRWMSLFFKEDTEKYYFSHLGAALQFLPYGVAVDEFQHIIYENPNLTPAERNAVWHDLEAKYLPHRRYENNEFLEKGGFWQKQSHIFQHPFYYIDYTLAQICAFQFWKRDRENHKSAWADYVKLCKAGGSMSFLGLVELAGLRSPFENGCIEEVVKPISAWLASVDDSKF
jgi:M3 family oligoendopeptidase